MSDSHSHSHLWPGVPLALASAALFGAVPPLSKLLLASTDPFMIAGLLYLGAGIGLAIYQLFKKFNGAAAEAQLTLNNIPWLAAAIAMGGIAAPLLLMFGLMRSDASSSALLLNLEGLATMAIAWIVYRENVDRRLMLGAFAILAGAVVLSWDGQALTISNGALLVALACLAWGLDNNFTRKVSSADPVVVAMLKGLIAGSVNVVLALFQGAALPTPSLFAVTTAVGFVGIGVSLVMFILALRHLGTARTGAYYSLAPFIGALLAIVMLGEALTLKLIISAVLMGVGLWLHLSERHEHEHTHDALEHDHAHSHDDHHQHSHEAVVTGPHSHMHRHQPLRHKHIHFPDLHHRHGHNH